MEIENCYFQDPLKDRANSNLAQEYKSLPKLTDEDLSFDHFLLMTYLGLKHFGYQAITFNFFIEASRYNKYNEVKSNTIPKSIQNK